MNDKTQQMIFINLQRIISFFPKYKTLTFLIAEGSFMYICNIKIKINMIFLVSSKIMIYCYDKTRAQMRFVVMTWLYFFIQFDRITFKQGQENTLQYFVSPFVRGSKTIQSDLPMIARLCHQDYNEIRMSATPQLYMSHQLQRSH